MSDIDSHSLPDNSTEHFLDIRSVQSLNDIDLEEEDEYEERDPNLPKKRGRRKKKMTKARIQKLKVRRVHDNTRERNRMHGLTYALDTLREHVPCKSETQKLSKIDTLRLARNYINTLAEILKQNSKPDPVTFAKSLSSGLSQNTMNLVASGLKLNPKTLRQEDQIRLAPQPGLPFGEGDMYNQEMVHNDLSGNPSEWYGHQNVMYGSNYPDMHCDVTSCLNDVTSPVANQPVPEVYQYEQEVPNMEIMDDHLTMSELFMDWSCGQTMPPMNYSSMPSNQMMPSPPNLMTSHQNSMYLPQFPNPMQFVGL